MATPVAGTVTSYDLTAGVKLNFDEMIYLVSPTDLPMTLGVDADGSMVVRSQPVDQTIFYWQDEEILVPRVFVAAAATTGDTALTVTTGEGMRFATGDLVRVVKAVGSTEVGRVTAVAANTVTIARGYASTTATNIASGDVLIGIGTVLAEGSDPENFRSRDRDVRSNYTEIFGPYQIKMSRTERSISKYGVNDEWAKQTYNRTRELMIRVEQALIYGIKDNDTSAMRRATGGLIHFLTSNVDNTSTQLTLAAITAMQQQCYDAGDVPLVLMAKPHALSDLNDTENTSRLRVTETDSRRGRVRVSVLDTEFGSTTLMRNRYCASHHAFLLKPDGLIRRILDPLQYQPLAKTGDADKAQLVSEEGFEIKGHQHMAVFNKLTSYTLA